MLCMTSMASAQGRKIAGITFPPELKTKTGSLYFNGCGLREKYTLDLYVAGLYLNKPTMDAKKVINADAAQAIKIVIVSSKVTRDKFNESVKDGFANAAPYSAAPAQIKKFKSFFAAPFNVNDEILMMSIEDGKYYGLNPVGSEIWKLIEEPKTIEEIIPALMEIFDIDEESCRKESLDFIESMIKNNIITIVFKR